MAGCDVSGEALDEAKTCLDLPQQDAAVVVGDASLIKASDAISPTKGLKRERPWDTLCFHKPSPRGCVGCRIQHYLRGRDGFVASFR